MNQDERLLLPTTRSVEDLVAEPIASVPVSLHIWDLERLFRCATSGQARETIEIDVVAENGAPLPCLAMPEDSADYRAFLCILPGRFLHRLYERYGDRLLERNVRSFLQARGKVNRGIRDSTRSRRPAKGRLLGRRHSVQFIRLSRSSPRPSSPSLRTDPPPRADRVRRVPSRPIHPTARRVARLKLA